MSRFPVRNWILLVALGVVLLAACSDSGKFFVKNNSRTEIRLEVNDYTELVAPGKVSRDYRRTRDPPIITIETDACSYSYEPSDFYQPTPNSDLHKYDRMSLPILIEKSIQADGVIRLYQVRHKDRSRIFEIKPGGSAVHPRNKC